MKTLKNHTLLYDSNCPLCAGYTSFFIRQEYLDQNGRIAYKDYLPKNDKAIDLERAKSEIALINHETGEITYGIHSLTKVFGHRWGLISKLSQIKWMDYLLQKAYAFISFNRKVITPADTKNDPCAPTINVKYRIAYILVCWIITSLALTQFATLLPAQAQGEDLTREFIIAGGQLIFQLLVLFALGSKDKLAYLGNMMTISLLGSLLLLIPITISLFFNSTAFNLIFFFGVVLFMIYEHQRRVKLIQVNPILTLTWVLYRMIVLLIILNI